MKLTELLAQTNLDHSLLIGYYGGGNYGDELLLEVLGNLLVQNEVKDVTITYNNPLHYHQYHHDFGYPRIDMQDRGQLIGGIFKNKNIIIGGGGLWGVDMNFNTFLLSLMLFIARRILGKKVYLFGVGFYNSTNRMGRIAAWLAGKAANHIVARDQETLENFGKITKHVSIDTDMAWHVDKVDLEKYRLDVADIERKVRVDHKTLLVALRRPQSKVTGGQFVEFTKTIANFIEANSDKSIILAVLESESKSPDEHKLARSWAEQYPNVQLLDFPHNPLALYLFFQKYHQNLALIGPQFHIIITAHLTGVPFTPVVYDNKVSALFDQIGIDKQDRIAIKDVKQETLQAFTNSFYGSEA